MSYHKYPEKQEDFRNSFVLLGVTSLWHVAQWVSRAPPQRTLSAFLDLNGRIISFLEGFLLMNIIFQALT